MLHTNYAAQVISTRRTPESGAVRANIVAKEESGGVRQCVEERGSASEGTHKVRP